MDSGRANKSSSSRIAKTFQKVIHLKSGGGRSRSSNPAFCLLIPQEKLRCCESQQAEKEDAEEAKEESKTRAAMEAFVAKLFATISAVKAAYAELQIAQFPYNNEAIQSADQAVVDELKALSELKYSFLKRQIDSSPPHVTLMLAEIQEQQALMKTYEITMKKMRGEIENKDSRIGNLHQQVQEIVNQNKNLEKKLNASGSFSILDNVKFSDLNPKDFILVLNYALRSVRSFVKLLIREMEAASWDIDAAANAIQADIVFSKRNHRAFAFESFVCREIFAGFNDPGFSLLEKDQSPPPSEMHRRRVFFFEQFKRLRSASAVHFLKSDPNSLFGKFLRSKYLQLVHPKMEFSFAGNLNQRKMVNSGEYPETDLFKTFAEVGRRVWLLHCLAFSFSHKVTTFQVKHQSKFSEVYMESVAEDVFAAADGGLRVAFTVVPGFIVGQTVLQSQVYLFPHNSPSKS
ncbi:protein GRAVITROPIC IN THE LIGHT 1-like [Andrographis paniculata]|uniref:protein GRAVITROPIC IN THE LIGHT 1-like n=1 Tax=Andrographis paniculata TaxID=175694 RepID=UPI0021E6EB59|nr:protein GRAVITROPIC IN THE LIGHT 1-like [Andrographis paniculata]